MKKRKLAPRFKYALRRWVEVEEYSLSGQLFWPSAPSVRRKPAGWEKNHSRWGDNRKRAIAELQQREWHNIDIVKKKLAKYKLQYTERDEQRGDEVWLIIESLPVEKDVEQVNQACYQKQERGTPMTDQPYDFASWQDRLKLSNAQAAEALGVSKSFFMTVKRTGKARKTYAWAAYGIECAAKASPQE